MHQLVCGRGHLTFQQFFGRFGHFLLGSLPFGEVQNGATFVHVALNQPRCWRNARVGGPLGLVAVAVEARLLSQGPGRRRIPTAARSSEAGCCGRDRKHQLNRQEGADQASTNPEQPLPVEDIHRHLHGVPRRLPTATALKDVTQQRESMGASQNRRTLSTARQSGRGPLHSGDGRSAEGREATGRRRSRVGVGGHRVRRNQENDC